MEGIEKEDLFSAMLFSFWYKVKTFLKKKGLGLLHFDGTKAVLKFLRRYTEFLKKYFYIFLLLNKSTLIISFFNSGCHFCPTMFEDYTSSEILYAIQKGIGEL